jgi:hypothetical protein
VEPRAGEIQRKANFLAKFICITCHFPHPVLV